MTSPYAAGLESVRFTLVPLTETELTDRETELTVTAKAEAAGTMFARERLYVSSSSEGEELWITELT